MTSLYQIDQQIEEFFAVAQVNEETGEIFVDFEKLDALQVERNAKIENIIKYYKDLLGDVTKFKAEEKALSVSRNSLENKAETMKKYLDYAHEDKQKHTYGTHLVSWRKSEVAEPVDVLEVTIPEGYEKIVDAVPDISHIKKDLKLGNEVAGWKLTERLNIQIK